MRYFAGQASRSVTSYGDTNEGPDVGVDIVVHLEDFLRLAKETANEAKFSFGAAIFLNHQGQ